ncbi:MAG: hypothetical protein M1573_02595 [Candidatus Parvarchaeota archaeon]|nr:hypothetical protein [Candidatus Parvarchaeota archaeon]
MAITAIFGAYDLLVFLLVFSLVYGLLSRSKFFLSSDISALIALAIGLSALLSSYFVVFIINFLPYVLAMIAFVFLMLMLVHTIGVSNESVGSYLKRSTLVPAIIILMMFIFALIAYGNTSAYFLPSASSAPAVSPPTTTTSTSSGSTNPANAISTSTSFPSYLDGAYILGILTTPSVLSLLLTLAAMTVAVYAMTKETPKA